MKYYNKLNGRRKKALALLAIMALDTLMPLSSFALTGGPSQPEVQSFEPVGTSEMVDIFSGDFNYNIPLLDVNGYPINIAYHAGISADQEASWVGLGWNINPGTINRGLNGLPDDMNGETITKELNMKDNWTLGLTGNFGVELFGLDVKKKLKSLKPLGDSVRMNLSFNLGMQYNSYKGVGVNWGAGVSSELAKKSSLNAGLSLGYSDEGGMNISPDLGLSSIEGKTEKSPGFRVGATFNSRAGMRSMNIDQTETVKLTSKKKKRSRNRKVNGRSMYSFGSNTYTPNISTPFTGTGVDFSFKYGTDFFGVHGNLTLGGSFYNQRIKKADQTISKVGYGYLYEQEAPQSNVAGERDYILDFQRQNELPLMETTPYLPWAQHTHDMYGVSAQGVGGTYRLYRNDISVLHDDYRKTKDNSYRLGLDAAAGNLAKLGVSFGFNHSGSKSGLWTETNELLSKIGAVNNKFDEAHYTSAGNEAKHYYANEVDYEPTFFREVNELIPQNEAFLDLIQHDSNLFPRVFPNLASGNEYPRTAKVYGQLFNEKFRPIGLAETKNQNIAKERTKRNKLFTYLPAKDWKYCLNDSIYALKQNAEYVDGELEIEAKVPRLSNYRKGSHISEVTIVNNDGSRHVFGLAAYNKKQIEQSFRVDQPHVDDKAIGLASYTAGTDNSLDNDNGIDGYYSSTETPPYAHSYLITGVLSPDYVDLTNNGITEDDLGSAVKFNYTRVHAQYKWRTPYKQNMARFAEGQHSDVTDGMGSVVYGEKEIWHVHSIEGKTHIALFKISRRDDGLGVLGKNGGRDTSMRQYKLDSIQLFSKRDLRINGSGATPIKTVHFEYDYSLCPGVANQVDTTKGKLTLKKIYFTYGNSRKGKLNAYKFSYDNVNPSYHLNSYDMWGSYSPVKTAPDNAEYPYVNQESDSADKYAAMWNLNKIELPSGGVINVEYEADDYAYVQDRRAMSMFKIKGFARYDSKKQDFTPVSESLYGPGKEQDQYDYLFFELKNQITGSNAKDILRKEYFKNMADLQVSVYVNITRSDPNYEYVKTYVKPAHVQENGEWKVHCGVTDNGNTGWVRIEKQHIRDKDKGTKINPIALSAFQYARMNLNFLIQRGGNSKKSNENGRVSLPFISTFTGMLGDIANMAVGHNRMLMERLYCRQIDTDRSWVRLNVPDKIKKGGGHRVKEITMSDMWADINDADANAQSANYGQKYQYTIDEKSETGVNRTVSSGVATYEPRVGRDENPFVVPKPFDLERPGVPDDRYTFEHPVGEMFMPGASVGYSRVTVSSIDHSGQNESHRTGYQVSEFFTAKDHPVIIKKSDITKNSSFTKPRFSFSLIYGEKFELATAGQGYTVILNDMHGKPKANFSYNESGVMLSGASYEYQTDDEGNLLNDALVIQPNGDIEEKTLGVSVDLSVDFQKKSDEFFNVDGDFNLDVFAAGFVPIFVPTLFPNVNFSETNVYTAVATKVVRKVGLLKKTTAYKEGSEIHTENLAYDGQTGQVLLTSVGNEFGDDIYNFNYPAHWAYDDGMGQAFKNWGLEISGWTFTNKVLGNNNLSDISEYLFPGDKCLLTTGTTSRIVYVVRTDERSSNWNGDLTLLSESGSVASDFGLYTPDEVSIRVLESGRKNMASVSIGSVTTMTNPIQEVGQTYNLTFTDVLATSAVEYKDHWKTELPYISNVTCDTVLSDFYWSIHNSLKEIVDSTIWSFYADPAILADSGTQFPDTNGIFNQGQKNISYYNLDTCWTNILESYLDDQSLDFSDLEDSIFTFKDLTVDYDTTPGGEFTLVLNEDHTYYESQFAMEYLTTGFDPYLWINTEQTSPNTTIVLPVYYKDLQWNESNCKTGNVRSTIGVTYSVLTDTIYHVDTNSSSSNIKNILDESRNIDANISSLLVHGNNQYVELRFGNSSCDVEIYVDESNVIGLDSIIDYEVIDTSQANITAIVTRYAPGTYDFDTTFKDTVVYELTSPCYHFKVCEPYCFSTEYEQGVNPYRTGIRGNWRPFKSWTYVEDRDYDATRANPQSDGKFSTFNAFWVEDNDKFEPSYASKWVWTSEVTEYSPYGMELENKDPLGRYSAAMYGYAQTLPTAVGSNMQHRQMWYEGFEEYQYLDGISDLYICDQWRWVYDSTLEYYVQQTTILDDSFSHSGNMSLNVGASDSFIHEVAINPGFNDSAWSDPYGKAYVTDTNDQIIPFRPTEGKYLLSAWVHQEGNATDTSYDETYVKIEFDDGQGGLTSVNFKPTGIIINGWQRIEGSFDMPAGTYIMRIKYVTGTNQGWFDDLRIHPYSGNMKSYAYDYRTLRLMAELDENNYATFYEYDLEGNLVRIKKETERGIRTLQENRQHQVKSN
jgi:hypothetical protein